MIASFYSFKGGVGRSQALTHCAYLLAKSRQKNEDIRVLVIDLDLEAPGLERHFPFDGVGDCGGFARLYRDYSAKVRAGGGDLRGWLEGKFEEEEEVPDPSYIVRSSGALRIDFMPSGLGGQRPAGGMSYSALTRALRREIDQQDRSEGWPALANRGFLAELRELLNEHYTYVLVDSRTGLADESFVSTVLLADALVLCFRLNEANIDGLKTVYGNFLERLDMQSDDPRAPVIPVMTPVPSRGGRDIAEWIGARVKPLFRRRRPEADDVEGWVASPLASFDEELVRLYHDPYFELGDELLVDEDGELIEGFDAGVPIVRGYLDLVKRLTFLNSEEDWQAADALKVYFRDRPDGELEPDWQIAYQFWLREMRLTSSALDGLSDFLEKDRLHDALKADFPAVFKAFLRVAEDNGEVADEGDPPLRLQVVKILVDLSLGLGNDPKRAELVSSWLSEAAGVATSPAGLALVQLARLKYAVSSAYRSFVRGEFVARPPDVRLLTERALEASQAAKDLDRELDVLALSAQHSWLVGRHIDAVESANALCEAGSEGGLSKEHVGVMATVCRLAGQPSHCARMWASDEETPILHAAIMAACLGWRGVARTISRYATDGAMGGAILPLAIADSGEIELSSELFNEFLAGLDTNDIDPEVAALSSFIVVWGSTMGVEDVLVEEGMLETIQAQEDLLEFALLWKQIQGLPVDLAVAERYFARQWSDVNTFGVAALWRLAQPRSAVPSPPPRFPRLHPWAEGLLSVLTLNALDSVWTRRPNTCEATTERLRQVRDVTPDLLVVVRRNATIRVARRIFNERWQDDLTPAERSSIQAIFDVLDSVEAPPENLEPWTPAEGLPVENMRKILEITSSIRF